MRIIINILGILFACYPFSGATNYTFEYGTNSGSYVANVQSKSNSALLNLPSAQTYYITVFATLNGTNTHTANEIVFLNFVPPVPPTQLQVLNQ